MVRAHICDVLRQRRVALLSWCLGAGARPAALQLVDKYEPVRRPITLLPTPPHPSDVPEP
jgi:hypothetical protein